MINIMSSSLHPVHDGKIEKYVCISIYIKWKFFHVFSIQVDAKLSEVLNLMVHFTLVTHN